MGTALGVDGGLVGRVRRGWWGGRLTCGGVVELIAVEVEELLEQKP